MNERGGSSAIASFICLPVSWRHVCVVISNVQIYVYIYKYHAKKQFKLSLNLTTTSRRKVTHVRPCMSVLTDDDSLANNDHIYVCMAALFAVVIVIYRTSLIKLMTFVLNSIGYIRHGKYIPNTTYGLRGYVHIYIYTQIYIFERSDDGRMSIALTACLCMDIQQHACMQFIRQKWSYIHRARYIFVSVVVKLIAT